jgi:hypothetical protein
MAIARWLAADRQACDSCREDQRVMGIKKDCAACPVGMISEPPVLPENIEACQVFNICRNQWRTGFGGAYAIDGNLVWKIIEDRGAANKTDVFSRVDCLASHYLEALRAKQPQLTQ